MNVTFRFFSLSKDLAGKKEMDFVVNENATLYSALDSLFQEIPALKQSHSSTMYAVGVEYAPPESPLHDGDIISVLPPMQGG